MLYAKLVARISEVSRTLIMQGDGAHLERNSTLITLTEEIQHSERAGWIKILEGAERGVYPVVRASGHHVYVAEPFSTTRHDVTWEMYEHGVLEEDVRRVLLHLPDVLMECEEGEKVKTHLGVIQVVRRKRKRVKDLEGRWTHSPERLQARLRPGKRLQRLLEEDPNGCLADRPQELPSADEDPLR